MKALGGFGLAILLVASGSAQSRGGFVGPQPFVTGAFGNAVFPGGTSGMPGITRFYGNAAFPSGFGFPRLVIPGALTDPTFLFGRTGAGFGFGRPVQGSFGGRRTGNTGTTVIVPYAVPVYAGGFYDNPYLGEGQPGIAPQQQPNVTVVYPPVAGPVMVPPPNGDSYAYTPQGDVPAETTSAEPAPPEPEHYMIAFKDHTIYSAVAFWVDGDTLHYFTTGNTHNQASLSLVDKPLTERLNKELGVDMKLP